jgi:hypothetical protein
MEAEIAWLRSENAKLKDELHRAFLQIVEI